MASTSKWSWAPIMLPYCFLAACLRWVGMRIGKKFVWPEEVLQACAPEANDPINMNSSIDTTNRWARAFILLPKEYYTQRNKRVFTAQENIEKQLAKKYKL